MSNRATLWGALVGGAYGVSSAWCAWNYALSPQLGRALCVVATIVEAARLAIAISDRRRQQQQYPYQQQHHQGRHSKSRRGSRGRVAEAFESVAFMLGCTAAYFFLAILLGAPATTSREETFTLACLLAVLTAAPLCLYGGAEAAARALTGAHASKGSSNEVDPAFAAIKRTAFLVLIGAWCGGVAVPLDWERPWQSWPVPCYIGAGVGCAVSHAWSVVRLLPSAASKVEF